jgi:hypothetical protein
MRQNAREIIYGIVANKEGGSRTATKEKIKRRRNAKELGLM